ncbi:MAG: hypothetical protein QNJ46_05985 [Leptolyngbyaceae cyanobacterium MO_188.B28]|nr:hypothetical protein [Leptolyngbyaceae cyanobacterium MO_188.B28]
MEKRVELPKETYEIPENSATVKSLSDYKRELWDKKDYPAVKSVIDLQQKLKNLDNGGIPDNTLMHREPLDFHRSKSGRVVHI